MTDRAAYTHLEFGIAPSHRRRFEVGYALLEVGATVISDTPCCRRRYGKDNDGAAQKKRHSTTLDAAAAQWMFQFKAPSAVAMRRAHSYRALVLDPATTHRESRAKLTRVRKPPPQGVEV